MHRESSVYVLFSVGRRVAPRQPGGAGDPALGHLSVWTHTHKRLVQSILAFLYLTNSTITASSQYRGTYLISISILYVQINALFEFMNCNKIKELFTFNICLHINLHVLYHVYQYKERLPVILKISGAHIRAKHKL